MTVVASSAVIAVKGFINISISMPKQAQIPRSSEYATVTEPGRKARRALLPLRTSRIPEENLWLLIKIRHGGPDEAMSDAQEGGSILKGAAQKGLLKLMMKLPSVREQLQTIVRQRSTFSELLSAYGEATAMLDRLERGRERDEAMILEYRTICAEIENDVMTECLKHSHLK
ncbi:hypothetical protein [Aliirhizobium smilacinae]|uniref:Uncharacterized protein n=1 Tax=Aliirhizobium smilacinae TaxID=1395944 RepID=A0A5C4XN77_9HYPH|nr:hypothetical protein [Rhizobium smilacinae]TNM64777.1 hypothetical protein FHP24_00230 [Rhizobium smilacinae]